MFDIDQCQGMLAAMIAAETSGIPDARPEPADYEIATQAIEFIKDKIHN